MRVKPALISVFVGSVLLAGTAAGLIVAQPAAGRAGNAVLAGAEVFVPAGLFLMGCAPDNMYVVCDDDASPIHAVYLDAFYIDRTEVTNAQYAACVAAEACSKPLSNASYFHSDYYTNPRYANHPVINVDWVRAYQYCAWVGKRLPSEAEWEKAARGTDMRWFPWGNEPPTCDRGSYTWCTYDPVPVGSYPTSASPYGALDMVGNVREWVNDFYDRRYYDNSPYFNPRGPEQDLGKGALVRGGSWADDERAITVYVRLDESEILKHQKIGFRCARSAPGPTPTPTSTPTPFAAGGIGPDGGALWLAYPGHLTLLDVSPGALDTTSIFTLTYNRHSNIQGDLQGIDHFFSLEAASASTLPMRLSLGFHPVGLISNTINLYRLENGGWLTSNITVAERTPNFILAWVENTGVYGVLGRTNRLYLPVVLRSEEYR